MTSSFQSRLGTAPEEAIKAPCRAATTANITLSGEQTIDGVSIVAGDRVFVKNQTTGSENGIYVCQTSAWTRATDWNGAGDVVSGMLIPVTSGTVSANVIYIITFSGDFTVGTSTFSIAAAVSAEANAENITFSEDSGDVSVAVALDARTPNVLSLSALQAVDTSSLSGGELRYMKGRSTIADGGEGVFVWRTGVQTTNVTNDEVTGSGGDGGVWIAPASDLTGASGAWERFGVETINVKWYGAVGNGTTDDTTAIQAAIDYVVTNGGELFFPVGIYILSSVLTATGPFRMSGVPSATYQDFANDIGQQSPSYAGTASIIQYGTGLHGAILDSDFEHSIENMVFRCGQARTTADVFIADRSLLAEYIGCKFENLSNVFGDDTGSAFGPSLVRSCRFFSCGSVARGVVVDSVVTGNVFTSSGTIFDLTPGCGYLTITGNRFEFCTQALYNFQGREVIFNNNLVDSMSAAGIRINGVEGMSVVGNLFWRNGLNDDATGRSHIQITGTCQGLSIVGNNFQFGEQDGGGIPRPQYVYELESTGNSCVQLRGNNVLDGYVVGLVVDTGGTSQNCLDADRFDLTPGDFNPNTASDTFDNILNALNSVCLSGTYPKVYIYENRKVNNFGIDVSKLFLCSGTGSAITIDLAAGGMTFDRLENFTLGGNTFTDRGGVTQGTAIPNGFLQQGTWPIGKSIYYATPAAGSYIGAVKVASGTPDTWKQFGAILT